MRDLKFKILKKRISQRWPKNDENEELIIACVIKLIAEALSIYFWTGISLNASADVLFCIYFNVGISCN